MVLLLFAAACSGRVTRLGPLHADPTTFSTSPTPSVSIYPVPSPTPPRTPKPSPYVPPVIPSLPPQSTLPPQSPTPVPSTPGLRTFSLEAHGKATAQFTVTQGTPSATFTTTYTGEGELKVTLVTPAGDVIASSSPGKVFLSKQASSDAYLVGHPGPGLWQVKVLVTSAKATVAVTVAFSQSPKDNAVPIARGKQTLKGRTVTVDAAASTDKDGTISTHMWDFGDGTITSGAQATHEYAAPGTYTIVLVVEDNQTGLGFAKLGPITVAK